MSWGPKRCYWASFLCVFTTSGTTKQRANPTSRYSYQINHRKSNQNKLHPRSPSDEVLRPPPGPLQLFLNIKRTISMRHHSHQFQSSFIMSNPSTYIAIKSTIASLISKPSRYPNPVQLSFEISKAPSPAPIPKSFAFGGGAAPSPEPLQFF